MLGQSQRKYKIDKIMKYLKHLKFIYLPTLLGLYISSRLEIKDFIFFVVSFSVGAAYYIHTCIHSNKTTTKKNVTRSEFTLTKQ